jgi:hypothetical protein
LIVNDVYCITNSFKANRIKANNQELFVYFIIFDIIFSILIYTIFNMTNLSIILPDTIAEASTKVAKELGVSRTEFIRRAIIHELDNYKTKSEELGIIKSFNAMKQSTKYSKESKKLIDSLFTELPQEEDKWWDK